MDALDKVIELMNSYAHLGVRVLENGTRLIGHVPHVAPEAWLHMLFAPLSVTQIAQIERDIGTALPDEFASFLKRSNGLSLFSDALSIDGLRTSYARTGDSTRQPFSIITPNVPERPLFSRDSFVFIGGYRSDGSLLYIDKKDSRVYRCKNRSAKPLNEWSDFGVMLHKEATRLSLLFDNKGRKLNPDRPTTP
jgi:hypothetical protein